MFGCSICNVLFLFDWKPVEAISCAIIKIVTPEPGGVFEVRYHPRKKKHVIRVVFQGSKTCKIG